MPMLGPAVRWQLEMLHSDGLHLCAPLASVSSTLPITFCLPGAFDHLRRGADLYTFVADMAGSDQAWRLGNIEWRKLWARQVWPRQEAVGGRGLPAPVARLQPGLVAQRSSTSRSVHPGAPSQG